MIFSMDLRRAAKGDCFLLHTGTKEEPGLVMVDGGPRGVYAAQLKPRIAEIRAARGLAADRPLKAPVMPMTEEMPATYDPADRTAEVLAAVGLTAAEIAAARSNATMTEGLPWPPPL